MKIKKKLNIFTETIKNHLSHLNPDLKRNTKMHIKKKMETQHLVAPHITNQTYRFYIHFKISQTQLQ